jgi:lipopolysaccharide export LptBFGC system permease protein LptF
LEIRMKSDSLLQLIIAAGVLILMAFCLIAVVFVAIPKEQLNLFTALASGVIGGAFGIVVGFLFGSSLGAGGKDAAPAGGAQP